MFPWVMAPASRIGRHVRRYGVRSVFRTPLNELRHPRLDVTRRVRSGLVAVGDLLRRQVRSATVPADCLVFAFDFGCAPITFDFATFLAGAELERRARGLEGIFVVFIRGPHQGLRRELPDYESAITPSHRHGRIRHVIIPMLALLPSVRGYVMCPSREWAGALLPNESLRLFPADFRTWLPRQPSKR